MASTNRRREIERFNEDLDRLIAGNDVDAAGEYEGLLDIAADLVSSDFSRASGVRESLRARLLGGSAARRRAPNGSGTNSAWTRVRLLAAPVLAALTLAIVAVAWPGAITAAASQMEGFVQELILGKNTTVAQVGTGDIDAVSEHLLDDVFSDQGSTIWISKETVFDRDQRPPLADLIGTGQIFESFSDAQAAAGFRLRQPAYVPPGYQLRDIRLTPMGWAIVGFSGPSGAILLAQVPGESGSEGAIRTEIQVFTDQPIAEVSINGLPAAWVEGRSLSWVDGDVSYTLAVNGLSLEEAIRIVESLD